MIVHVQLPHSCSPIGKSTPFVVALSIPLPYIATSVVKRFRPNDRTEFLLIALRTLARQSILWEK